MHSSKGFSLIELMIVVGIIGILSLIGMPIYNDYVTKVKLTELVVKHMYLARQIEIELEVGGIEAAYSFLRGSCTSGISESDNGMQIVTQCTTNLGIQPNGTLPNGVLPNGALPDGTMYIRRRPPYSNGDDYIFVEIESHDKAKRETFLQSFTGDGDGPHTHVLSYFPDDIVPFENNSWFNGPQRYFRFGFQKNNANLEIIDKNGNAHPAEHGRWYCGTVSLDGDDVVYVPKSIRPSMCPYLQSEYIRLMIED